MAVMAPVVKAAFDLASLGLVWVGTLFVTLGGIPALASALLMGTDGALLTGIEGALLTALPDPAAVEAYHRYMGWARAGTFLITLGMAWQAVGPFRVLLDAKRQRRGSRP